MKPNAPEETGCFPHINLYLVHNHTSVCVYEKSCYSRSKIGKESSRYGNWYLLMSVAVTFQITHTHTERYFKNKTIIWTHLTGRRFLFWTMLHHLVWPASINSGYWSTGVCHTHWHATHWFTLLTSVMDLRLKQKTGHLKNLSFPMPQSNIFITGCLVIPAP